MKTLRMSWMGLVAVLLLTFVAQVPARASVDVIVSGVVTESGATVAGATVKLTTCHRTFTTLSDSNGQYTLVIPSAALSGCTSVDLFGSKLRSTYWATISVASLKASPQRDILLYNHHGE